ncbi:hypothetical protein F443_22198 [Phytophthora nicotianae P1569]|uniref:Uncharacterized protein n=1 Tax=Phytophthora nicotianae P1569 TaxID=1317065 RepID=V9DV10_PHYNI|nr:hypothetical protein F443_22198 [Phytophthora nicotianae P1569]
MVSCAAAVLASGQKPSSSPRVAKCTELHCGSGEL